MTELFSICRGANRRRIACQAETLTVRPSASHGIIVFKTACNRYGGHDRTFSHTGTPPSAECNISGEVE